MKNFYAAHWIDRLFVRWNSFLINIRYLVRKPIIKIGCTYRISDVHKYSEERLADTLRKFNSSLSDEEVSAALQRCRGTGYYQCLVTNSEQAMALDDLSDLGLRIIQVNDRASSSRSG